MKAVKKDKVDAKGAKKKESKKLNPSVANLAAYYDIPAESATYQIMHHKMMEILESYLKTIQQILQPEDFYSIHECTAFDDAQKGKLFDLYSRIMINHREILRALILNEESDHQSTIQLVHSEILAVKPMMLDIVKKLQRTWNADAKQEFQKGRMHYFG